MNIILGVIGILCFLLLLPYIMEPIAQILIWYYERRLEQSKAENKLLVAEGDELERHLKLLKDLQSAGVLK